MSILKMVRPTVTVQILGLAQIFIYFLLYLKLAQVILTLSHLQQGIYLNFLCFLSDYFLICKETYQKLRNINQFHLIKLI